MRVLWRAARWLLLGLALLVGLLLLPLIRDTTGRFAATLLAANPIFLLPALALAGAWILAFGALIREAGAAASRRLPVVRTGLLASALQFIYAFPAGAVAGLVYETRGVERMGVPRGTAMLIVGIETVVFYGTFFVFLLVGLFVLALVSPASGGKFLTGAALLMAAIAGLALGALYVLGDPIRANAAHHRLTRWFGHGRGIGRSFDEVAIAVQNIRDRPRILARPAVAALAHWGFVLFTLGFTFLAFGARPAPAVIVTGFTIAFFVGRMTPIPGGIGAFEGTMTAIFTVLGVPFETALSVTIAFRILTFFLPALAGFAAHQILVRYTAPDLDAVVPVQTRPVPTEPPPRDVAPRETD